MRSQAWQGAAHTSNNRLSLQACKLVELGFDRHSNGRLVIHCYLGLSSLALLGTASGKLAVKHGCSTGFCQAAYCPNLQAPERLMSKKQQCCCDEESPGRKPECLGLPGCPYSSGRGRPSCGSPSLQCSTAPGRRLCSSTACAPAHQEIDYRQIRRRQADSRCNADTSWRPAQCSSIQCL